MGQRFAFLAVAKYMQFLPDLGPPHQVGPCQTILCSAMVATSMLLVAAYRLSSPHRRTKGIREVMCEDRFFKLSAWKHDNEAGS